MHCLLDFKVKFNFSNVDNQLVNFVNRLRPIISEYDSSLPPDNAQSSPMHSTCYLSEALTFVIASRSLRLVNSALIAITQRRASIRIQIIGTAKLPQVAWDEAVSGDNHTCGNEPVGSSKLDIS
ncbi:hypothetical protein D9758_005880 [Tetrapyrgos nigripes]|uniref:Uncharacterized protein n=1 Tax=Tetrapyrgos nigripes TaxID=182062 RepID=A0A8H5G332_9AGAR|nr:hypothetical protein D9758_005880 [Tetrapyrgos nigripes]